MCSTTLHDCARSNSLPRCCGSYARKCRPAIDRREVMANLASRTFVLLICISSLGVARADDTFRCGSKIIAVGMTQAAVLESCGKPTSKTDEAVPVRSGNQVLGTTTITGGPTSPTARRGCWYSMRTNWSRSSDGGSSPGGCGQSPDIRLAICRRCLFAICPKLMRSGRVSGLSDPLLYDRENL